MISPPDWAPYELVLMRLFLVLVLLYRSGLPKFLPFDGQSHPVGVARVVDLSFLVRGNYRSLRLGVIPAGVLYVTGVLPLVGIAYLAVLTLLVVTLDNSQGAVNHGSHLLLVVLMAQLAAAVADPVLRALDLDPGGLLLDDAAQTAAWWSVQAVAASYFVSGVTKLARTGFAWVGEASRLSLAMVVQTEVAMQDRPRRVRQDRERRWRVASWLSSHRVAGGLVFAGGLWLELLAPLALIDRWALVVGGVALIALHRAIGRMLLLPFRLYQLVLVIFLVNPPYLVVESLRWLGVSDSLLP